MSLEPSRCKPHGGAKAGVAPRIFQDDTPEDRRAIQSVLTGIMMYPLAEFDGTMKSTDWANLPKGPPRR